MRGYGEQGGSAWLWGLRAQLCEEADKARDVSGSSEKVVPFSELLSMIEPFYLRVGPQGGRPPYRREVMLRISFFCGLI